MTYVFGQIAKQVRAKVAKVHNSSFDFCKDGILCYGVPLLPEQEDRLDRAGEKLAALVGFPSWLAGIAPIFDGNRGYIEVGVLPGKTPASLPAAVDDFPVVVRLREHVLHGE